MDTPSPVLRRFNLYFHTINPDFLTLAPLFIPLRETEPVSSRLESQFLPFRDDVLSFFNERGIAGFICLFFRSFDGRKS